MATSSCSAAGQPPPTAISLWGSFASATERYLHTHEFGHVLSFLSPKDLARAEAVCRFWNQFIGETNQWRKQYLVQLNSAPTDPALIPGNGSYKRMFESLYARIYDEGTYRHYLGAETESASAPIPSLKRFNEPDPCDPAQTIGEKYVWIHSPPYFEVLANENFLFELDKLDDPNAEEAPRLIPRQAKLGANLKRTVLKVPNTIHNLGVLFKHIRYGNPSNYDYIWQTIDDQHSNKRIPRGWICMREEVIGRNLTFAQQQAAARAAGVVIPQLGHRVLYNFLRHAETNTYPDGQNPWTFARTSTLTTDSQGTPWPSGCGGGGPSGLRVSSFRIDIDLVGVAVALPAEVQAIGP